MKIIVTGILAAAAGIILWYGIRMGSAIRTCGSAYQEKITSSRMHVDVMAGDHRRYCSTSYDLITSWESCIASARRNVPDQIQTRITPWVMGILRLMGDTSATMTTIKEGHDEECKDEIDLMFYPPPPLQ